MAYGFGEKKWFCERFNGDFSGLERRTVHGVMELLSGFGEKKRF